MRWPLFWIFHSFIYRLHDAPQECTINPLSCVAVARSLLGLLNEHGRHILHGLVIIALLEQLLLLVLGVPVLHGLEFSLLLGEVEVEGLLGGGALTEMKVHLGVEAGLQALLFAELIVVKVRVEVGDGFLSNIARLHAVAEDDTSGAIEVHLLVDHVLRVVAHGADSHGVLS